MQVPSMYSRRQGEQLPPPPPPPPKKCWANYKRKSGKIGEINLKGGNNVRLQSLTPMHGTIPFDSALVLKHIQSQIIN
jgi:hypothetical protein